MKSQTSWFHRIGMRILVLLRFLIGINLMIRGLTYILPHCSRGIGFQRVKIVDDNVEMSRCINDASISAFVIYIFVALIFRKAIDKWMVRLMRGYWIPYLDPDAFFYNKDAGVYIRAFDDSYEYEKDTANSNSIVPAGAWIMQRLASVRIGPIPMLGLLYFTPAHSETSFTVTHTDHVNDDNSDNSTDDSGTMGTPGDELVSMVRQDLKNRWKKSTATVITSVEKKRIELASRIFDAILEHIAEITAKSPLFMHADSKSNRKIKHPTAASTDTAKFSIQLRVPVKIFAGEERTLVAFLNTTFVNTIRVTDIALAETDDTLHEDISNTINADTQLETRAVENQSSTSLSSSLDIIVTGWYCKPPLL